MKRTKQTLALTLCLAMLTMFIPAAIAASPNSTAGTATTMPVNGSISGEGDSRDGTTEQWYKITTTSKGLLYFDVTDTYEILSYGMPTVQYYYQDSSGEMKHMQRMDLGTAVPGTNAKAGTQTTRSNRFRLPAGTYYIKIHLDAHSATHEYTITSYFTAEGNEYETEFNDTLQTAQSLALDTSVIGNLSYGYSPYGSSDIDYFKINVVKDGTIQIRIDQVSGGLNIIAELQNSSGLTVSGHSVIADNTFSGFKVGTAREVKAGETYYVKVGMRVSNETGTNFNNDYKLTVLFTETAATPAKHTLTVTSGTGGGSYEKDAKVNITANTPATGKVFDKWTGGNGGTFANASNAATTFTMPDNAATVTATYKDAPANAHVLTVTGGTGGGSYEKDTKVNITANAPAAGKVFDKWTGGNGGTFANANSAATTFTMPDNAATVTATYKDAPATPEVCEKCGTDCGCVDCDCDDEPAAPSPSPSTPPANISSIANVAAGGNHSVALDGDGNLWTWGRNFNAQLGTGKTSTDNEHTPVQIIEDMVAIVAGDTDTVAIKSDGTVWSWGGTISGDGTNIVRLTPAEVKEITNAKMVSSGSGHKLAVDGSGRLWTWGNGGSGRLGTGVDSPVNTPGVVMTGVKEAHAGSNYTLVVKTDGTLWGFGNSGMGQLGVPSGYPDIGNYSYNHFSPVKIMDDVVSAAAGNISSYAVKKDGSLWAWGANNSGQLGTGNTTRQNAPVKIIDSGVKAVSAGGNTATNGFALILKTDGSLWACGNNQYGQLLDGTMVQRTTPVKVLDGGVAKFSAGGEHSLVIMTDGRLLAGGRNNYGQLGDGTTENRTTPVFVMDVGPIGGEAPNLDSASTWAKEGITEAVASGYVPVEIQGDYKNVITRAEFCKMAVKWVEYATNKKIDTVLSEQGKSRDPGAFTDTSDPDILAAYALGITSGTGGGKFTPDGQFTREQAATMIMNTYKAIGIAVTGVPDSGFADIGTASSWAVNGINFVRAFGIMSGTGNNNFSPQAVYTREQSIITFNNIKL